MKFEKKTFIQQNDENFKKTFAYLT